MCLGMFLAISLNIQNGLREDDGFSCAHTEFEALAEFLNRISKR